MNIPVESSEIQEKAAELAAQRNAAAAGEKPHASLTPLERELAQETARAIDSWRKTAGADEKLAALRQTTNADELQYELHEIVGAPQFARMWELIAEHRAAAAEARSFTLNSISVGLAGQVALIVGGEGSIGVAFIPTDPFNVTQDAMYLSVEGLVGGVEAVIAGIVIGFWQSLPIDLRGSSVSVGGEIDLVEGVVVQFSFSLVHMSFLGFSVAEATGEAAGVEVGASYTFTWQHPFVYQPPAKYYMILNSIQCVTASENGHDEVFFTFTIDGKYKYRYPSQGEFSMADGDQWNVGRSMRFNDSVYVQLWDSDGISNNDALGSYNYLPYSVPATLQTSGSGGTYNMTAILEPLWETWPAGSYPATQPTSAASPAICTFGDDLYLFWRGVSSDTKMYYSVSSDGVNFGTPAPINTSDSTNNAPAAVEYNNSLWVLFRGMNGYLYYTSASNGTSWPAATQVSSVTMNNSPAVCVFNGLLYVFYNSNDSSGYLYFVVFNGSTWTAPRPVIGGFTSPQPMSVCVARGGIWVFWMDTASKQIFVANTGAGLTWGGGGPINMTDTAWAGPASCAFGDHIVVAFPGNGSPYDLRWTASVSMSWPTSLQTNGNINANVSQFAPAMTLWGGQPYIAWTTTGSERIAFARGITVGG